MDTREHLLDLGEDAVRQHGFGGFSYADLAKEAGIRKASIHHHFPAKRDLGLALIERFSRKLDAAIGDIAQNAKDGRDALSQVVAVYREALGDGERMCLCAALAADCTILSEEMQSALARANVTTIGHLAHIAQRGAQDGSLGMIGDAEAFAASLLAQLQGAQLLAKAASDPALYDKAMGHLSTAN